MTQNVEATEALFDATRPIALKTFGPEGIKPITLRFPTDEEWIERESRRKTIIEFTATGDTSSTVLDADEEETELLRKLCPDSIQDDIEPMEAGRLIDQLKFSAIENEGEGLQGNHLRVALRVPGALTTHTFRMPSAKELQKYHRNLYDQQPCGKRKVSSIRNLRFLGELYSKMILECTGYAGAAPVIHQADALFLAFLNLEQEIDSTKNF